MESNPIFVCANPSWSITRNGITSGTDGAKHEALYEVGDWYAGYGFSDNCYLVPTKLFKQPIYNEYHPASDRYPTYAGEGFEKRVDSYMHNHNLLRISNKYVHYSHVNFPKKPLVRLENFWQYKVRRAVPTMLHQVLNNLRQMLKKITKKL